MTPERTRPEESVYCSCKNPQPHQYLTALQSRQGRIDVYRCDSCGKQVRKLRKGEWGLEHIGL
jgi:hypothetical protein